MAKRKAAAVTPDVDALVSRHTGRYFFRAITRELKASGILFGQTVKPKPVSMSAIDKGRVLSIGPVQRTGQGVDFRMAVIEVNAGTPVRVFAARQHADVVASWVPNQIVDVLGRAMPRFGLAMEEAKNYGDIKSYYAELLANPEAAQAQAAGADSQDDLSLL